MPSSRDTAPAATQRFDTVDLLRGLSILAVVLHHTMLRLLFAGYSLRHRIPPMLLRTLFWNGANGVTVFFAVSGFLITLTSLRRFGGLDALKPAVFYRIRFARIAPLLLLVVGLLSALALMHADGFQFTHRHAPLWRAVLAALTFHLNWLEARYGWLPANWDVLWSLSIEEMFYLFFPLVCLACLRFRRGLWLFLLVLFGFVAMGPFARSVWTANEIWQEKTYLGGMDAIALGCLTALLTDVLSKRDGGAWPLTHRRLLLGLQLAGAAALIVIALGPGWFWKLIHTKYEIYGTEIAFATCLVMLGSVLRQPTVSRGVLSRLTAPIRWYGRHSYEVYLTHEFLVIWMVQAFLGLHPNPNGDKLAAYQPPLSHMALWFLAVLAGTVPLGWLLARFFSEPLNRKLRGARPPRPSQREALTVSGVWRTSL